MSCGQAKWEKAQKIIRDLSSQLIQSTNLDHKDLEQKRGFLVHLQRTYPCITPFLKGIHLTLDSWRPGRDADGWRIPSYEPDDDDLAFPTNSTHLQPPSQVSAAPRLAWDLEALEQLLCSNHPPTRFFRATHTQVALYGFGDASGSGFGSSISLPKGCTLFRHGLWNDGGTLLPPTTEN